MPKKKGFLRKVFNFMGFHRWQALSLFVAVLFLWWSPFMSHGTAMVVSSVIILVNVLLEIIPKKKKRK
jgi:hypothetical protein